MSTITTTDRHRRTCVAVFTPDSPSDEYRERAEALVGSLNRGPGNYSQGNGSTIKADVFSVSDRGEISRGLNWPTAPTAAPVNVDEVVRQARSAGYTQVVPVIPGA